MATTSDIKRLKTELNVIWTAIQIEVKDENPRLGMRERNEMARSRFISLVDEAAREVVAGD